jgi:Domain of unknown function (DUF4375)
LLSSYSKSDGKRRWRLIASPLGCQMTPELQAKWSDVCDRWDREGYLSLSSEERTWLNIRSLIDSIENGGLISYFYNSGADTIEDCLRDLEALGASNVRIQVARVCALFPGGVPSEIGARNAIINSWSDDKGQSSLDHLLEEVDDALMPLLEDLEVRLTLYLRRCGLAT